jgi:hypothetical protein
VVALFLQGDFGGIDKDEDGGMGAKSDPDSGTDAYSSDLLNSD